MLSGKVDLTEDGAFGGLSNFTEDSQIISMDDEFSVKEFNKKFENTHKIFHLRPYYTSYGKLFSKQDKNVLKQKSHCLFCGKELKVPWGIIYNCCNDCGRELKRSMETHQTNLGKKFPWDNIAQNNIEPIDSREILKMR